MIECARDARASGVIKVEFSRRAGVKPLEGIYRTVTMELDEDELAEENAETDSRKPLGMEFSLRLEAKLAPHRFGVMGITPDGAADRAGMYEGDVLLEINGVPLTDDMGRPEVERLLHEGGSRIQVRVMHSNTDDRVEDDDTRVITLRRDQ